MTTAEAITTPSLQRSKRFATIALISAILTWLVLMVVVRQLVSLNWLIFLNNKIKK